MCFNRKYLTLLNVKTKILILINCDAKGALTFVDSNDDAKRLLDDLFSVYNTVSRPVVVDNSKIELSIGLKLSQIADIVGSPYNFKVKMFSF